MLSSDEKLAGANAQLDAKSAQLDTAVAERDAALARIAELERTGAKKTSPKRARTTTTRRRA